MLSELTLSWIASILKISIYSKSLLCPQRHVYIAGEEATDERSWWSYKPTPDQFSLPHYYQPVICFRVYRHIIYECRYDIYNSTTMGVVTFFFFHTIGSSLHSHAYLKLTVKREFPIFLAPSENFWWMIFKIKNENLWMVLLKKFCNMERCSQTPFEPQKWAENTKLHKSQKYFSLSMQHLFASIVFCFLLEITTLWFRIRRWGRGNKADPPGRFNLVDSH